MGTTGSKNNMGEIALKQVFKLQYKNTYNCNYTGNHSKDSKYRLF